MKTLFIISVSGMMIISLGEILAGEPLFILPFLAGLSILFRN